MHAVPLPLRRQAAQVSAARPPEDDVVLALQAHAPVQEVRVRVLVCGSRTWTDEDAIYRRLLGLASEHKGDVTVVHGRADGADRLAGRAADRLRLVEEAYPADWDRYGRAAGPIRNAQMLRSGIDLVIAFWDGRSKGTKHMLAISEKAGVPVEIHQSGGVT
jgi:hypothetical protein